ncbi:hypothetical protein KPH14_010016 [Odynerus spinipes]|uniref:Uncharacterized protein n=1 Tax=Odynerus spinipes TaxID=1348599 RepID=A0AAD9VTB8_9HYME|nr:hypothetical protein KPH14_010016 [Odynerus spinipes]
MAIQNLSLFSNKSDLYFSSYVEGCTSVVSSVNISKNYRKIMALQLTRRSMLSRMTRQFYNNNKKISMSTNTKNVNKPVDIHSLGSNMYAVTDFDKRILVWVKRFPSIAEVPKEVTRDCMLQAKTKARVRVCNIMIVCTIIGFILAAISGKRDVAAGRTLYQRRQEWYEGLRREHEAEVAAAAAAAEAEAAKK